MDIYVAEDVPVPPLEYKDNQDVLDLIMKRPLGLIPMLDEEGLVPRGSWEGFLSKYSKQHAKNPRYKKAKLPHDLGVVHYAGEVFYDATLFLVKNKDTLSVDLVEVFSLSKLPLLQKLFATEEEDVTMSPTESSSKRSSMQASSKMTVGRSFSLQLEKLIADLNATQPRYIRCIKPNQVKKPNIFVPDLTNEQLTYSGVFEAVIIMQNGYPFRRSHEDFRKHYHMLVRDKHALLFDHALLMAHNNNTPPPPPPPLAVPNADGTVAKKIRKPSLPCSRAQCQLLVTLISETNPGQGLERCFVGKTRAFYQAPQHNALEALRSVIVQSAALKIQRRARGYMARNLTQRIRAAEKEWYVSLTGRQVDKITPTSEAVDSLVVRLNRAVSGLDFYLDCSSIGKLYHHAFESENRLTPAIKAAIEAGRFVDEITPIMIPQRKGEPLAFATDEQPRAGTTAESLGKLKPAFKKDGSVTAGNASSLNDGASAVLLMSAAKAQALGLPVLAKIASYANAGVDPAIMGIGPVSATQRCLAKAGWNLADLDLIEANEAFAAQALAVGKELNWDASKVNVNGGAIALGHPIGAAGARILVSLLHELIRRDGKKGLATLCIGGGQGVSLAIER